MSDPTESNVITIDSGLKNAYPAGSWVYAEVAGISGVLDQPIMVAGANQSNLKLVLIHELFHRALGLNDIDKDRYNIMLYKPTLTSLPMLRYNSLEKRYVSGVESQWYEIHR